MPEALCAVLGREVVRGLHELLEEHLEGLRRVLAGVVGHDKMLSKAKQMKADNSF
jgi:hypothetical protein